MAMLRLTSDEARSAGTQAARIVVLFENNPLRDRASRFCHHLQRDDCRPEVHWCSFGSLQDPAQANSAGERVTRADVIVFAASAAGDLPPWVKLWIEQWLGKRGQREGALVGLIDQPERGLGAISLKEVYLRHLAHRAEMDYLSDALPTLGRAIPDSLDSFSRRAGKMTSVLDQILHTQPRPRPAA